MKSTYENAIRNLGIFIGSITAVVCAFALKLKLLCKDINQKILLQKHKCVNKHRKENSHALSYAKYLAELGQTLQTTLAKFRPQFLLIHPLSKTQF